MGHLVAELLFCFWGLVPSHCFNIETERPEIFVGKESSRFGQRVLQFGSDRQSWIIVSAPEGENGTLYRCYSDVKSCDPIFPIGGPENNSLPTVESSASRLVACGPNVAQPCVSNMHLSGICYIFDQNLEPFGILTPGHEECTPVAIDVVFLFDGSNSLTKRDLENNKRFMLQMMTDSDPKVMQFAVVQYSGRQKLELDFHTFRDKRTNLEKLISQIELMESVTLTAKAINFVIENVFTEEAGARDGATRLLIVITDGETTAGDLDLNRTIELAKQKDIVRCAIGVGTKFEAGSKGEQELEMIATSPSYLIKVKQYEDLKSIFESLKTKIYNIEGAHNSTNESSFEFEMSQGGFSAIVTPEAIALGAVGAYDWSGGLMEFRGSELSFINVSKAHSDMKDAYLGYSVKAAVLGNETLYVVGAPRYQHRGKVIVFQPGHNGSQWEPRQHISGNQIGSYFGSELCTVDLTGDGETDLLLIGAPLYHDHGIGGTVTVCTMSPEGHFSCAGTLRGDEGNGLGRFGTSIAALRDLNGDGLGDVAIGAPLEDEHRGSVYIYHGETRGISPRYSQRVAGRRYSPTLRYFGLSISGVMDVSEDTLTDLVVGGLGMVAVFRSRPVLNVSATIAFHPEEIPHAAYECRRAVAPNRPVSNATVCFRVAKLSADNLGNLAANITYTLLLDAGRQKGRATFRRLSRRFTGSLQVHQGEWCRQQQILLPSCVKDYFVPIELSMNFTLDGQVIDGTRGLRPVLNEYSETVQSAQLPFQKDCASEDGCVDYLRLFFNFSGGDTLVVGGDTVLIASVVLDNAKEDSYHTRLIFLHPARLSFKKITAVQPTSVHIECDDVQNPREADTGSFGCNVNHPIFPKGSRVSFDTVFDISTSGGEEQANRFIINASSENPLRITNESSFGRTLLLRYAVHIAASGLGYTRNVNFTAGQDETRLVKHSYQVENLSRRSLPIGVAFTVPVKIGARTLWNVTVSERKPGNRSVCQPAEERALTGGERGVPKDPPDYAVLNCGIALCVVLRCSVAVLEDHGAVIFDVQGELKSLAIGELNLKRTGLPSKVLVTYDEVKYVDLSEGADLYKRATLVTDVDILDGVNWVPLIVGSTVGGLVLLLIIMAVFYKFGFFKRNIDLGDGDAPGAKTSEGDEIPAAQEGAAQE